MSRKYRNRKFLFKCSRWSNMHSIERRGDRDWIPQTIKKSILILVLLIHSSVVFVWSIFGQRLHTLPNYTLTNTSQAHQKINILANYIALTGSEQYWDLFASDLYNQHLSLIVCDDILFPGQSQHVECIGKILYQSFDGDLPSIFNKFSGNRSRSYRFTEQFIALNNEQAYQQFLEYWDKQASTSKTGFLYLIAQFHLIAPNTEAPLQTNQLLWALERS